MDKRKLFRIITLVAIVIVAYFAVQTIALSSIKAQGDIDNMRQLLEQLQSRMNSDENFQIAIRLHTPIIDNESLLIVPDKRENTDDELSRFISEIGEDYICFDVLGGSARTIECVPFSNIASIRYFVE